MKKIIKLINNERLNAKITSSTQNARHIRQMIPVRVGHQHEIRF